MVVVLLFTILQEVWLLAMVADGGDLAATFRRCGADQQLLEQVFAAKKPTQERSTTGSFVTPTGGVTVYNLIGVLPGRPEDIPLADRDAGKLELSQQYGSFEYTAFVQALYEQADIVISEDALAAQDLF